MSGVLLGPDLASVQKPRYSSRLPLALSSSSFIIELDIAIGSQRALPNELPLLLHNVLDRDSLITEDLKTRQHTLPIRSRPNTNEAHLHMITNQMPILTPRTRNQHSAEMIRLLRDAMG